MKKILIGYLIDGKNSGIDNYILNIIDQIKNDNVKIDCLTNHIDNELKSRLDKLGVGLLEIPTLKHPYSHYCAMKAIIQKESMILHISIYQRPLIVLVCWLHIDVMLRKLLYTVIAQG